MSATNYCGQCGAFVPPHHIEAHKMTCPDAHRPSNLVAEIRRVAQPGRWPGWADEARGLLEESADEIERLRAALAWMIEAVRSIEVRPEEWCHVGNRLARAYQCMPGMFPQEIAALENPGVPMSLFDALAAQYGTNQAEQISELIAQHNVRPADETTAPHSFVPDADGGFQVDSCIDCGKPRREHRE